MLLTAASTSESQVHIPFKAWICVYGFLYYAVQTGTKENFMRETTESRQNSGECYCHFVQNVLYLLLLPINIGLKYSPCKQYNFVFCIIWLWHIFSQNRGKACAQVVGKERAEKSVWTEKERSKRRLYFHDQKLYGLSSSKGITRVIKSRMTRLAARVAGTGETEGPTDCWWRKRPTGKPRLGWDDNIEVDFKEIWQEGVDYS